MFLEFSNYVYVNWSKKGEFNFFKELLVDLETFVIKSAQYVLAVQ